MPIGDGRKTYSDSTLKFMTKDELIDIIRCMGQFKVNIRRKFDEQTDAWIKAGLTLSKADKEELMRMSQLRE